MASRSKKIAYIFSTVICFLVAGLVLFIGFGVTAISLSRYSESHTYEYEATFIRKETDGNIWQIYVQEYGCSIVFECGALADEQNFEKLTEGDKLTFRSNIKIEVLGESANMYQFPIVALSSDGKDIVTFESSKSAIGKSILNVKITCIVFALIFIIGAVISILYLAGVLPVKRKTLLQNHN